MGLELVKSAVMELAKANPSGIANLPGISRKVIKII